MKKGILSKQIRFLIILSAVALVLGALVFVSANYSVRTITEAIDSIGKVTYSEESRTLIDAVDGRLRALDPNLRLEERIENLEVLKEAKVAYVEQAIIRMYRAIRDKEDEALIRAYYADAEEALSHYLTEADFPLVHNYLDLVAARLKYGQPEETETVRPAETGDPDPIELC